MNSLTKMSILKSLLGGLTFFCLVSLTNVIFAQNDLFTEVAVETIQLTENQVKILNGLQQHRTTIDLKVISVNKEILMSQQSIDMNLFSGQKFTASTVKIDKRGDRDFTWYGSVRGKVSNIVLSVYEDAVVGFMNIEAESYNLRALGESLNAIIRVDPSKYPPCGNTPNFDNIQNNPIPSKNAQDVFSGQSQNFFSKASSLETSQDDVNLLSSGNTIIKVLVAYTPAARDGEGGVNAMNALICNSIAAANQSYNNSNIPIQLELALRVEVNYTKVGTKEPFETECVVGEQHPSDLMRFQNPSDGYMDEIHDLRALSAADVAVLLFIPQFPVAVRGEAFTIGAIDSEAFCVVDHLFADADKSWTFAHEIGHLQGARHEHENDSGECPFAFGHGHLLSTVPQKKTMMAVKPGPDRIQYWSDPTATFQGVPLGVAGVSDNAIALTETAPSVANLEQEGGTVVINNDVTVGSNSTLNIAAGTTIKFAPTAGLIINGTINATGTSAAPVTVTRSGTSCTWDGIVFNSGSSGTLTYATIDHATKGMLVSGTDNVTVDNCTIQNFTEQGVYASNSSLTVQNSTIQNPAGASHGIYLLQGGNPTIKDNTIDGIAIGIERKDSLGLASV